MEFIFSLELGPVAVLNSEEISTENPLLGNSDFTAEQECAFSWPEF